MASTEAVEGGMRYVVALGLSAGILIACGGDGDGGPDMPGMDAMPDTPSDGPGPDVPQMDGGGPVEILDCDRADLIITHVDLDGSPTADLHNPTSSAITLNNTNYTWCRGPSEAYVRVTTTPVTIPAGGTATFNLPMSYGAANGMLSLFRTTMNFTSRNNMVAWMCWGAGLTGTRRETEARTTGSDGTVLWSGTGCIALGGATDIYRIPNTAGNEAADYTTTEPVPGISCM
jgi:hypothetical protein